MSNDTVAFADAWHKKNVAEDEEKYGAVLKHQFDKFCLECEVAVRVGEKHCPRGQDHPLRMLSFAQAEAEEVRRLAELVW